MKTLFIVSTGLKKPSDELIRQLEEKDEAPRTTLLEVELNTQLLDERYLNNIIGVRKYIYKWLPVNLTQILEAFYVQGNYDAVVSYYERVGLPFAFLQKIFGSKTPHILLTTWFSSKQKSWFVKRVHASLAKIITWSSNQYQFAINHLGIPPKNIKLIKRGVDQNFWRPIVAKTDIISSAGMEMRDYPTLIKALKTLDIPCHIATGTSRGKLFDTVKSLYSMDDIPKHITVGERNPLEMRELYSRSRFVVIPLLSTDTDNGLTVILEAMSMGKAVICSKVDGQIDVIKDGVTGIYVSQGDPNALRNAVKELWENPQKAEQMGNAAREYILKYHKLEQFVANIKEEVFHSISKKASEKTPELVLDEIQV